MFAEVLGSQYADHASINLRRFSSASLRRHACSALSPMTWTSAVSVISRGKLETLPAQSRKLERKPRTVACVYRKHPIRVYRMMESARLAQWLR
jgi:hypothetical protein